MTIPTLHSTITEYLDYLAEQGKSELTITTTNVAWLITNVKLKRMRRKTEILSDIEKQSLTLKAGQFRRSATDRFWIRGRVENTTLSIKSRKSTLDRQEAGKYDTLMEGHQEGEVAKNISY